MKTGLKKVQLWFFLLRGLEDACYRGMDVFSLPRTLAQQPCGVHTCPWLSAPLTTPSCSSVERLTTCGRVSHHRRQNSREIKTCLLLGGKLTTNLDSILKSRDITLPTKVCLVKAMVFLVVMYGCESWTIKKVKHRRIDAFELCCWRRLMRVPWIARRSSQFILKEISPEYSLEGLMLKLKLQYFGHLMQRTDTFEKTLMLGKIEGGRRGQQRDEIVGRHH